MEGNDTAASPALNLKLCLLECMSAIMFYLKGFHEFI